MYIMKIIHDGYIYTNHEVKGTTILWMCIQPRRRHDNETRYITSNDPRINCTLFPFSILSQKKKDDLKANENAWSDEQETGSEMTRHTFRNYVIIPEK